MNRKKAKVLSIACGVLCAACVLAYLQSVRGEADAARAEALERYGGEQLEVCVAKRDIAAGENVDAGAVETRLWVADLLPADALRSPDAVVGRQATSSILAGEVLSSKRFDQLREQLEVPDGLVAVSVPAKSVQAVGGAVVAGSHVDMYASGSSSTEVLARNVLVLATSASGAASGASADISWITMALEPESVQEVVAAAQRTELHFALPGAAASGHSAAASSSASAAGRDTEDATASGKEGA